MSAFAIFFIVVTIGYILYYAAIITIDMHAKPKGEASSTEDIDNSDMGPVEDAPPDEADGDPSDDPQDEPAEDITPGEGDSDYGNGEYSQQVRDAFNGL